MTFVSKNNKLDFYDNNTVRGSTTTTADQLNSSNGYEHTSQIKKFISPTSGFNGGMKAFHPNPETQAETFSIETLIKGGSNQDLKLDARKQVDSHEQRFALILVIFSLSIFVGIFYISSDNIKVQHHPITMPIGIK